MNLDERADPDRVRGGYKAMASSIGMAKDWNKVKRYMNSKTFKSKIAEAKKKAKEADNPDAYLASVERRILAGHFGKTEDLDYLLNTMNIELGDLGELSEYYGLAVKPPGKRPTKARKKKKEDQDPEYRATRLRDLATGRGSYGKISKSKTRK